MTYDFYEYNAKLDSMYTKTDDLSANCLRRAHAMFGMRNGGHDTPELLVLVHRFVTIVWWHLEIIEVEKAVAERRVKQVPYGMPSEPNYYKDRLAELRDPVAMNECFQRSLNALRWHGVEKCLAAAEELRQREAARSEETRPETR